MAENHPFVLRFSEPMPQVGAYPNPGRSTVAMGFPTEAAAMSFIEKNGLGLESAWELWRCEPRWRVAWWGMHIDKPLLPQIA